MIWKQGAMFDYVENIMQAQYTLAFPYWCLGEHGSKCKTYWGRDKLPFCGRTFQTYFLVSKLLKFDSNFTEICSIRSNEHQTSFCSENGLEQSMRLVVICILSWPNLLTHICVTRPGWGNLKRNDSSGWYPTPACYAICMKLCAHL